MSQLRGMIKLYGTDAVLREIATLWLEEAIGLRNRLEMDTACQMVDLHNRLSRVIETLGANPYGSPFEASVIIHKPA